MCLTKVQIDKVCYGFFLPKGSGILPQESYLPLIKRWYMWSHFLLTSWLYFSFLSKSVPQHHELLRSASCTWQAVSCSHSHCLGEHSLPLALLTEVIEALHSSLLGRGGKILPPMGKTAISLAGEAAITLLFSLEEGAVEKRTDNTLRGLLRYPYNISTHLSVFCLPVCLHPFPFCASIFKYLTPPQKKTHKKPPKKPLVTVTSCAWCMYWTESFSPPHSFNRTRLYLLDSEINFAGEQLAAQERYWDRKHKAVSRESQTWSPWVYSKVSATQGGDYISDRQLTHRTCLSIAREKHFTSPS